VGELASPLWGFSACASMHDGSSILMHDIGLIASSKPFWQMLVSLRLPDVQQLALQYTVYGFSSAWIVLFCRLSFDICRLSHGFGQRKA
jgi:hypothetical protein